MGPKRGAAAVCSKSWTARASDHRPVAHGDLRHQHVLTAVPQGLAAAWSSYVVGNAANIYFRDAGWSGRSPRDIVQDILAGAEKQKTSILAPIRDQLKAKFGRQ